MVIQPSTMDAVMGSDSFFLADMLLTQPLQIIVGSKQGAFGSNRAAHELHRLSASSQKDLLVLDGASHFDLYDKPQYVEKAVAKLTEFFRSHLRSSRHPSGGRGRAAPSASRR